MKTIKEGRVSSVIHEALSRFLLEESSSESLITVSHVVLNTSGRTAHVYCSVFPEEQMDKAFAFLERKEGQARDALRRFTNLRHIPHVRFRRVNSFTITDNRTDE